MRLRRNKSKSQEVIHSPAYVPKGPHITNDSTYVMWLALDSPPTPATGIRLKPGESYSPPPGYGGPLFVFLEPSSATESE